MSWSVRYVGKWRRRESRSSQSPVPSSARVGRLGWRRVETFSVLLAEPRASVVTTVARLVRSSRATRTLSTGPAPTRPERSWSPGPLPYHTRPSRPFDGTGPLHGRSLVGKGPLPPGFPSCDSMTPSVTEPFGPDVSLSRDSTPRPWSRTTHWDPFRELENPT